MQAVQLFLVSVSALLVTTVTSQQLDALEKVVYAEKNDNITLTCRFSNVGGTTTARFKWYHEDNLVSFRDEITVVDPDRVRRYSLVTDDSMQRFSIQKVIASDGGRWRCEPTIGQDTFETDTYLVVKVPPSLVDRTPQERWAPSLGSSFELHCNASGSPKPNVIWSGETQAGGIVLPDGTVTEFFMGNILRFQDVSARHRGKYTCHASNGLKPGASAEYTVNLPFSPHVMERDSPVRVPRNQEFDVGCIVKSYPKITSLSSVSWTKDGVAISNNENGYEYSVIEEESDDVTSKSILKLPKVDSGVAGMYTCEFSNSEGTGSGSFRVDVGAAINPETGVATSGVAHFSGTTYLNLLLMVVGTALRLIW